MRIGFAFILTWMISFSILRAQEELIQITGFVYEAEFSTPLPYAHVLNPSKNIGKVTQVSGYFTIIGSPGDTIVISTVGYKTFKHVITPESKHLQVMMEIDVHQLPEAEVLPLPKNLLMLKEDLRNRKVITSSTILQKNMEKAGFKAPPTHPAPPPPSIMNPISLIYEKLFKKIQQKKPKKKMIEELPELHNFEPEDD